MFYRLDNLLDHFSELGPDAAFFICMFCIFGHLAIMLLAGLLCFPAKYIHQVLYDFFGFITSASFLALFMSLLILLPVAFLVPIYPMTLFLGIAITILSYLLILYKFGTLNKLGKLMQNTDFNNRSDDVYLDFYNQHYKHFFRDFFKEPPPQFVQRLHEGFAEAYKLGKKQIFLKHS